MDIENCEPPTAGGVRAAAAAAVKAKPLLKPAGKLLPPMDTAVRPVAAPRVGLRATARPALASVGVNGARPRPATSKAVPPMSRPTATVTTATARTRPRAASPAPAPDPKRHRGQATATTAPPPQPQPSAAMLALRARQVVASRRRALATGAASNASSGAGATAAASSRTRIPPRPATAAASAVAARAAARPSRHPPSSSCLPVPVAAPPAFVHTEFRPPATMPVAVPTPSHSAAPPSTSSCGSAVAAGRYAHIPARVDSGLSLASSGRRQSPWLGSPAPTAAVPVAASPAAQIPPSTAHRLPASARRPAAASVAPKPGSAARPRRPAIAGHGMEVDVDVAALAPPPGLDVPAASVVDAGEEERAAAAATARDGDPRMAAEYEVEIFSYLRDLERSTAPPANYMHQQAEVDWDARRVLVNWLVHVHALLRQQPETLHLAVNLCDRFLAARPVALHRLQLVAMAALLVSAKYEEVVAPTTRLVARLAAGPDAAAAHDDVDAAALPFSHRDVVAAENYMLAVLGYRVGAPGPLPFLRRLSAADGAHPAPRLVAKFLLDAALTDHRFVGAPQPLLAAAAFYVARKLVDGGGWPEHLAQLAGYEEAELAPAAQALCETVAGSGHPSVREKYADR
ncbi:G2/mitotic-specific cyclin, partial [Cladochytrium tenue]